MFANLPLANVNHKEWRNRLYLLIRAKKILWPFYFSIYHGPTYNHNDLHFSHLQSNSSFPKTQEKKKNQNTFWAQAQNLGSYDMYVV